MDTLSPMGQVSDVQAVHYYDNYFSDIFSCYKNWYTLIILLLKVPRANISANRP